MLEFAFLTVALACSGPILDYDTEFDCLSKIIVADGSTDNQRVVARKAIKVLTHQGITKYFEWIKHKPKPKMQ